ncbi:MAG: hypothetical protein V3V33_10320 [Candidatus Lokiarchaeia archaeon]
MREIYIFDIDGCVMPPIFSNFNSNETRKIIVKEVIKNGNNVNLYPVFMKFYEKYCIQAELVFFITGRKKSEFGILTENQLQSLANIKPFQTIYYPEGKSYKIQKYFAWKVKEVKEIIKNAMKNKKFNENSRENINFNIFDDMHEYFPKIRRFEDKWDIKTHLTMIENEHNWNQLL